MGRGKTGIMRTTKGEKGLERNWCISRRDQEGGEEGGRGEDQEDGVGGGHNTAFKLNFKVSSTRPSYEVAIVVPSKMLSLGGDIRGWFGVEPLAGS